MRIIAGELKGRKIKAPKGMDTRPTQDRVRETIFNVLQNYGIYGKTVLDLYAGTGALGIEAISRGAKKLVSIDMRSGKLIEENIRLCNIENKVRVLKGPIKRFAAELKNLKFELIFSDPPYLTKGIHETIEFLEINHLIAEEAIIVLEYDKKDEFDVPNTWHVLKEQTFGYTKVTYYKYQALGEGL